MNWEQHCVAIREQSILPHSHYANTHHITASCEYGKSKAPYESQAGHHTPTRLATITSPPVRQLLRSPSCSPPPRRRHSPSRRRQRRALSSRYFWIRRGRGGAEVMRQELTDTRRRRRRCRTSPARSWRRKFLLHQSEVVL